MTAQALHLANADRLRAIASEARKGARTPGVTYADEPQFLFLADHADTIADTLERGTLRYGFDVEREIAHFQRRLDRLVERNGE